MKKICIVTGSRAEYGLLSNLMKRIDNDGQLQLQVIVTGAHLSPDFGSTYLEIEKDGFCIDRKVDLNLESDTVLSVSRSIGAGVSGIVEALDQLEPDFLVLLGDRYEILSACIAGLVSRIPVIHIHGGEKTLGAFDDSIRHAITKMSHVHFVAAEEYRRRVIQMGEIPDRVFNVGGLGVDNIRNQALLNRPELEKSLGIRFRPKSLLVTYHPVTLEQNNTVNQVGELLRALDALEDTTLVFTYPNADPEGREILKAYESFVANHADAHLFSSLGQTRYFSCINEVDGVVGNSSSGLLEVPTFRKGTINIGSRQQGRLKSPSVIDCPPNHQAISSAIRRLYSDDFRKILESVDNPYGNGGAAEKIVGHIKKLDTPFDLKKDFHDIDFRIAGCQA